MLDASGIGTYLRQVVPRILDSRRDWRFTLLGDAGKVRSWKGAQRPNVEVVDCRVPIYSLSEQIRVPASVPPDRDLLWSPHYNIPLLYSGKLLVTVHDLFHLAHPEWTGGLHKRAYARLMFHRLSRRAGKVICVSEFTKKELIRFTGIREEKTAVIRQGVDPSWFEIKKGENPYPKPFLLYVGNVKPHKNLRGLLEAFGRIKDRVDHDLVVVGQKEGFRTGDPAVVKMAEAFGNRVCFTGWVEEEKLRQYYAHAGVLVFPSLYEGFGLPLLEAMAAGCPVASSWAASLPEVGGGAVRYFDPENPGQMAEVLREILEKAPLRDELRRRGLERARGFSWDLCAAETIAVMEDLLAGGKAT